MVKKLFELKGKNYRKEDIRLIFEVEDNGVNLIKYFEKWGKSFRLIFGYNTPYHIKINTEVGRFGVVYLIQTQPSSVGKGIIYGMYHGNDTVQIIVKPTSLGIISEVFENSQKVKELYLDKESYDKLGKITKKKGIRPNTSLNIPSFMRGM